MTASQAHGRLDPAPIWRLAARLCWAAILGHCALAAEAIATAAERLGLRPVWFAAAKATLWLSHQTVALVDEILWQVRP